MGSVVGSLPGSSPQSMMAGLVNETDSACHTLYARRAGKCQSSLFRIIQLRVSNPGEHLLRVFLCEELGHRDTSSDIVPLMREMFAFIADFEGPVPGAEAIGCGNYLDMNLPMAKFLAKKYAGR